MQIVSLHLFAEHLNIPMNSFLSRFLYLLLAIILTGIGAAITLNMRLIPNPGDGIVQAIADRVGKSVGLTKNCFDLFNITITVTIRLGFKGKHHPSSATWVPSASMW